MPHNVVRGSKSAIRGHPADVRQGSFAAAARPRGEPRSPILQVRIIRVGLYALVSEESTPLPSEPMLLPIAA